QVVLPAAPRVVDHVRVQVRPGVVAAQIGRGHDPLAGGQQRGLRATAELAALGGDPLGARGDADLVAGSVVADHRAHGVRTVIVVVARHQRRVAADVRRVEPVVVVVELAVAQVATVFAHQCRVVELDAAVDAGDHDALTAYPEVGPDPGRLD